MNRARRGASTDISGTLRYHSEERFRLLVESVKEYALFMLDCDGLVSSWNAGAERITGYAASEVVGASFGCFYPEEARETRWPEQQLAMAASSGRAEDEGWRVAKGGERFWAHTVITALRDAEGALRGYASTFHDLSERRRGEEQLAQNEERLRVLLSSVRDYAIIMLDPNGLVVSWSEGAEQIEGYRAEEVIGAHFARFFPAEAIERGWPEHELQVAATEGRFEDENWRVRKDGSRFWANVVTTALRDRHARLIGFCKITRDLTERRRQEEALRESQERSRLLIESVQDYAIHMLDASGQVMSWNAGAQRILGFEASEIVGKHFSRFYPLEDIRSGLPWQQLEAARQHGRLQVEGPRLRKDGASFNAHVVLAPVQDSEGKLRGYSHITHDLTPAHHLRALEDAERRTNEFLAVLSHELRGPLAPIRHSVAVLQRGAVSGETLARLSGIIDHQVSHLTRVLDDLLDVSDIVQGSMVIERGRVGVAAWIERALEVVRPLMEQRRQVLHVGRVDDALSVDGDLVRLVQVLVNLLDNASKFTPEGGELGLRVRRLDAELMVVVEDSGVGISAERLPQIFDAHRNRGAGVGLWLARRIVELHGGRIQARSGGAGRGAEFTVSLPLSAAPQEAPRAPAMQAFEAAVAIPATPTRRVLVVEDNVDSAASLTMLLQTMGYQTDSANDGLEALEVAERFQPDTVLLDIGLPRLDGYEVARRLRERDKRPRLIALTGWGQQQDRERARTAGFDHHLVKPVDLEQLTRILSGARSSTTH